MRLRASSRPNTGIDSRRRRRGQGLVEFALIVPVFLLFLLIAVDFGRILFTYIQLINSARETAAYAAFNPNTLPAQLTTIASREANVQAQRGQSTISATSSCTTSAGVTLACSAAQGGAGAGNRITVNVSEKFTFFAPMINAFWAGGLPVSASATAAVTVFASGGGPPPSSCTTAPPTPTFTWQSPDPVNRPFLISVDAGASTSLAIPCHNVGYNWDFGGLSTPANPEDPFREGVTMDYEFAAAGTYTVTLVISNAAGDSAPTTKTITLGTTPCNPPMANFTVSPSINLTYYRNPGHQGTPITFDGTSSAFMSDPACHPVWSWNLGDGSALKTTSVVSAYTYNDNNSLGWSGTHTVNVTLTVTNDAGTNSKTVVLSLVRD
jgi:Flp pilus assembly protein TadG